MMIVPARAGLVVILLAGVSACAPVRARTPVVTPDLEAPEPPPRLVIPPPALPEPEEAPPATTSVPPASSSAKPPPPKNTEKPPPPAPPPSPTPAIEPPPVLQTTQNTTELERTARALLDQAQKDLDQVKPATLSANARDQYRQARRFIDMSLDAIKIRNYVYARQLAESAASLAAHLAKAQR